MEKATKQENYSKLCFSFSTFLPMILVLLVVFSVSLFSPIATTSYSFRFTILIILLSTIFLVKMTRKKGSVEEKQVQEKEQKEDLKPSSADLTQTDEPTQQSAESDQTQNSEHQTEAQSESSLPSDGESFELDHHNRIQEMGISDNLASGVDNDDDEEEEEDSLIEISLPSSDSHGLTEESEIKLETKLPDFLPEYIFRQQGFRELFEEINEDDNLIEIDISRGSSKFQDLKLLGDDCLLSD